MSKAEAEVPLVVRAQQLPNTGSQESPTNAAATRLMSSSTADDDGGPQQIDQQQDQDNNDKIDQVKSADERSTSLAPAKGITAECSTTISSEAPPPSAHEKGGKKKSNKSRVVEIGRNVHVCGLPPRYVDSQLYELFQRFGPIVSAKMMCTTSKITGKTTGFVLFEKSESATNAVQELHLSQLEDETLRVRLSKHGNGVLETGKMNQRRVTPTIAPTVVVPSGGGVIAGPPSFLPSPAMPPNPALTSHSQLVPPLPPPPKPSPSVTTTTYHSSSTNGASQSFSGSVSGDGMSNIAHYPPAPSTAAASHVVYHHYSSPSPATTAESYHHSAYPPSSPFNAPPGTTTTVVYHNYPPGAPIPGSMSSTYPAPLAPPPAFPATSQPGSSTVVVHHTTTALPLAHADYLPPHHHLPGSSLLPTTVHHQHPPASSLYTTTAPPATLPQQVTTHYYSPSLQYSAPMQQQQQQRI